MPNIGSISVEIYRQVGPDRPILWAVTPAALDVAVASLFLAVGFVGIGYAVGWSDRVRTMARGRGLGIALVTIAVIAIFLWLLLGTSAVFIAMDASLDERPVFFNIITSVATAIGALGTFAAAIFAVRQLRSARVVAQDAREVAHWSSSRDSLWRFSDGWDRLRAAEDRLTQAFDWGKFNPALDDNDAIAILDFFDGLAYMANRNHIDDQMSWNWFYPDAAYWWKTLQPYIVRIQSRDALAWIEIPKWLDRLDLIEEEMELRAAEAKSQAT
jgi:hypothetical protein